MRKTLNLLQLTLLFVFLTETYNTFGQLPAYQYFYNTGGNTPKAVAIDDYGNIYVAGSFTGTRDFDPGLNIYNMTAVLTTSVPATPATTDIFISKIAPDGNLIWAFSIGAAGNDDCNALKIDKEGNIIFAGSFQDTVDFSRGSASAVLTPVVNPATNISSKHDIFLGKLDTAGNLLWIKNWGSTEIAPNNNLAYETISDLAIDDNNNIYTAGNFTGLSIYNQGRQSSFQVQGQGTNDAIVIKHKPNGDYDWVRTAGSPFINGRTGRGNCAAGASAIDIDRYGHLYITGYFSDSASFDRNGSKILLTTGHQLSSGYNGYVWKMDTTGNFIWARQFLSVTRSSEKPRGAISYGYSIAVDHLNDVVYSGGYFRDTVDFAPHTPGVHMAYGGNTTSGMGTSAYLVQIDTAGTTQWVKSWGGTAGNTPSTNKFTIVHSVAVDPIGEVYSVGRFLDTIDFDPGPGTKILKPENVGFEGPIGFISKFNHAGDFMGAGKFESNYISVPNRVITNHCQDVYVIGNVSNYNQGTAYLNPHGQTPAFQTALFTYSFLVRLSDNLQSPVTPDSILGTTQTCRGIQTYHVPPVPGAVSYAWVLSGGLTGSSTGNSIDIDARGSGTIRLRVIGVCDSTDEISLDIVVAGKDFHINVDGDTLSCSDEFLSYQWLLNGDSIPGATSRSYTVKENGQYSIVVTDEYNCRDTSKAYSVNNVHVRDTKEKMHIHIFPNPARETVFISGSGQYLVSLKSTDGREIYPMQKTDRLWLASLPQGLYILYVYNQDLQLVERAKITKQ